MSVSSFYRPADLGIQSSLETLRLSSLTFLEHLSYITIYTRHHSLSHLII